eukprot:m.137313 g.137313  ORF g.137313 m.137313 type:complete len:151 (+) comp16051_c0_seq7:173-625(+)
MGAEDLRKRVSKLMYDPSFSAEKRQDLFTTDVPTWLGHFERFLSADGSFIAPNVVTWVEFVMFDLLDLLRALASEPVYAPTGEIVQMSASSVLKDFPRLAAFYDQMTQRPRLAAYLKSSHRPTFKLPYAPSKPVPATPQPDATSQSDIAD